MKPYKKLFEQTEELKESDTVNNTVRFIELLMRDMYQGKNDRAIRDFLSDLLMVTAPGPIVRFATKWAMNGGMEANKVEELKQKAGL